MHNFVDLGPLLIFRTPLREHAFQSCTVYISSEYMIYSISYPRCERKGTAEMKWIGAALLPWKLQGHLAQVALGGLEIRIVTSGADSRSGDNQAGYVSDGSPITGISQLHDDGTGGSSSLGHFQLLPLTSAECAGGDLAKCTVDRETGHGEPSAEPGYFGIPLSNGVNAEVTVTPHTALHRFTYPRGTERMMLLVDVTSDLAMRYQGGGGVRVSTVSSSSSTQAGRTRVTGSGRWIPSFGQGTYGVFFCLDAPGEKEAEAQYFYKQGRDAAFLALNTTDAGTSQGGEDHAALLRRSLKRLMKQRRSGQCFKALRSISTGAGNMLAAFFPMTATAGVERTSSQERSGSSSLTSYPLLVSENGVEDAGISLRATDNTARQTYFQRNQLRFLWLILHVGLALLHLAILIIGMRGLERRAVFTLEHQATVSFVVTALSTGIGIGYLSTALFVTQKLAMHHNLRACQTLTATHDNIAAWNGLGSALSTLYAQLKVPASVFGTSIVAVYLSCLALLHITSPAIFSVVGYNTSIPVFVQTLGVPQFNEHTNATDQVLINAFSFFPWIDNLETSQKIGLINGSIYDVLQEVAPGRGQAAVTATGFNVTCAYLPALSNGFDPLFRQWNISLLFPETFEAEVALPSSGPNIITTPDLDQPPTNSLVLYTTNTVIDSVGNQGSPVELDPAMDYSVTRVQFLQCWRTLAPQKGMVDGESGLLDEFSLQPSVHKTRSTWQRYSEASLPPSDSTLLGGDWWTSLLGQPIGADIYFDDKVHGEGLLSTDLYLMELLNLDPSWISTKMEPVSRPVLALHDIENAVASLLATVFWLVGHVRPDRLQMQYSIIGETELAGELVPPTLTVGHTTVAQHTLQIRLEISLIAVSLGLALSILLGIVALPYALADSSARRPPVDSIGTLQTVWIFRRHAGLSHSLCQVRDPEEANLRTAGLITVQLFSAHLDSVDTTPAPVGAGNSNELDRRSPVSTRNSEIGHAEFSSRWDKIICVSLHVGLIIIQLALLGIVMNSHAEHAVVFPVEYQRRVSLWITLLSTGIGTIYLAAALYMTQKLALRKCVGVNQTLTAIHDQTISWAGIGSALSSLVAQIQAPANIIGTLCIAGYLATILTLHLSTPALFAVETFNRTTTVLVPTQGFPQWNDSTTNASSVFPPDLGEFLQWMSTVFDQSKTIGLFNGSLYDVLDSSNSAPTSARVSATGFNVTCGYPSNVSIAPSNPADVGVQAWNITLADGFSFQPPSSGPNILTTQARRFEYGDPDPDATSWASMILYTTNQVKDSGGNTGLPVRLHAPMGPNSTVSELQILQCSRSLISQQAEVDPYSRLIVPSSLTPTLHKTSSQWNRYEEPSRDTNSNLTTVINSDWPIPVGYSSVALSDDDGIIVLAWMDLYLMEILGLDPSWILSGSVTSPPPVLYLHDIENALASLLASYFWMVSHIHPRPLMVKYGGVEGRSGSPDKRIIPVLSASSTTVNRIQLTSRLSLNLVAVITGLCASVLCFLLSLHFMPDSDSGTSLTGMGFLQVIWLFRNHPWLSEELEQVVEPTDKALRAAGMIRVQLGIPEVEAVEMRPLADGARGCN
ncbi:hypothetical protein DFH06DRAFT_1308628 [Mycena polygramma]|nr:hypothetical protein DFH06DRAFT_1308628 [Mycena polygramma]